MARSTETDIAIAVLHYLASLPKGEASIATIRKQLDKLAPLSVEDREPSDTRAGEQMWEQQVRNIVSHSTAKGNFIAEGWLSWRPRHLAITPTGRTWLVKQKSSAKATLIAGREPL